MTDFERISKILLNSSINYGVTYYNGHPQSIDIVNYDNRRLLLEFYRDGKFMGIFIDDED